MTTNQEVTLGVISAGLAILNRRVLTLISMLMTMALFCWAMYLQLTLGVVCAGIFGVIVFLPVLLWESRSSSA